jgi:hypothetical protein
VQLRDLRSSQSITAITLRHPGLGLSISIRGFRPGWWADLGEHIDLRQWILAEVGVPAAPGGDLPKAEYDTPMPTPVDQRAGAIRRYCMDHLCSIKEAAARASVSPQALRAWRAGAIGDRSAKSIRIERLLQRGSRSD